MHSVVKACIIVLLLLLAACTAPHRPAERGTPVAAQNPEKPSQQQPLPPAETDRPPALIVSREGQKPESLAIASVKANVRIYGSLAETEMTMVFSNSTSRSLAGDLYFPLPEGAWVSGYGLDIEGALVDGVAVTKQKARQVFETEVRKGIDPGIVEWAKGNNFKTRVFPIPAHGSRTVMVKYVNNVTFDRDGASYRLPLCFRDTLKSFKIHVEVIKGEAMPVVRKSGPANLTFRKWQDNYTAEAQLKNTPVTEQVVIALPDSEKRPVITEEGTDGNVYFCLLDNPSDPRKNQPEKAGPPGSVTLYWDASGSREKVDHEREYGLLKSYFAQFSGKTIEVDLVLFSDSAGKARRITIRNGDAGALIDALRAVRYDGGTQIGCLEAGNSDACFLFTDGISNFGKEEPSLKAPLYIFSATTSANHSFLKYLASRYGGAYFNLTALSDNQALAGIGTEAYCYLDAKVRPEGAAEVYSRLSSPVNGHFTLAGRLNGKEARITVKYGVKGRCLKESHFTVTRKDAPQGDILMRFWAQKKIDDLAVFPERNEQEITATGTQYGMVTPFTSLIVLERLEQYVEHSIVPPESLGKMRARYYEMIKDQKSVIREKEKEKIDHVLVLWKNRLAWWEKEYSYPEDFRIKNSQKMKSRRSNATQSEDRLNAREPDTSIPTEAPMPGSEHDMGNPLQSERENGTMGGRSETKSLSKAQGGDNSAGEPFITIKQWDPRTPYIIALKKAPPDRLFTTYLALKKEYGNSPAFYLDCGSLMMSLKQQAMAIQVLSNIAELELENAPLLRVLAYKLEQTGSLDTAIGLFREAKKLRPEEPQSYRDLALALAARGRQSRSAADYREAMELLNHVVMNNWDRFDEIEVIALMDLNGIWAEFQRTFPHENLKKLPCDERLIKNLDLDIRILLTWDADLTDMDLHVIEPSGEKAMYSHNRTTIGGLVSRDFTQGYGPEEYCLRKAMHGAYAIDVNYYGSGAPALMGPVTVQAEVITNFGRAGEKRQSLTLRLTGKKETIRVGEIKF